MNFKKARILMCPCLFVIVSLYSCENDMKEVAAIVQTIDLPVLEESNAFMTYSDSAKIQVTVEAPRLLHFTGEDPFLELPKGVHVRFYNDSGGIETELTAKYAISFEKKDIMVARNDVVVINARNERLNTEELSWSKKDHRIFTEEFVTITTPDEVIYGHGLESNEDFSKYRIKKISGIIEIEDEKDL